MARIPPIKRLTTEDFREEASWIGKLLSPLNEFMAAVVQALNRGLTFEDNFAAQIKELEFTVSSSSFPMKFLCTLATKPKGLWVLGVTDLAATPSTLTDAVWADWEFKDGQVTLRNVSGLTTGRKYRISVIIIAG